MPNLDDALWRDDIVAPVSWPALPSTSGSAADGDDHAIAAAGTKLRSILAELRAEGDMARAGVLAREALDAASPVLGESAGSVDTMGRPNEMGGTSTTDDDELFQSADWDRASGRLDNTFDLDGE